MRSRPVDNPHFLEYQATILLCLAAGGLTLLSWQGVDLEFLTMDHRAWPREPGRLLTSCLLHASFLHLAFNLYWTLRFGAVLEPIFGSGTMAAIFAFLGAGSMAAEWAFGGPGIGLSGIGYGLFGLCWALDKYTANYRGILDERTTTLLVVWFFFCIAASWLDVMPVANWAHGAGAVLGGLLGLSLSPYAKRRRPARIGLALSVPLLAVLATVARPYVNWSDAYAWELSYDAIDLLERAEHERALELLRRSVQRDASSTTAWHNLGYALERLGRRREAAEAFRRKEELEAAAREEPRSPMDLIQQGER